MRKLDFNPDVIWWQSEEMSIKYKSPKDGRLHRYFPDFLFATKAADGTECVYMIEIKPRDQTKPPVARRKTARYLKEVMTYGVNAAKWQAAAQYCAARGWRFQVVTEKELFNKL